MTSDHSPLKSSSENVKKIGRLGVIWRGFTEPSASIPQKEWPQARLLSNLLLLLILFLLVIFPVQFFFDPGFQNSAESLIFGILLGLLFLGYRLSRTRYHTMGAVLTVLMTAGSIWIITVVDSREQMSLVLGPIFVIVSIILSSLLLSLRFTVWLSAAHLTGILLLPVLFRDLIDWSDWLTLVIFVGVTSALTVLGAGLNQRNQAEINRQSLIIASREAQLQSILDNSTAIIYLKDRQGRYLLVNRQYETVFQMERTQMIGKTSAEIFPKEIAEEYWASDKKILETGISSIEEQTITDENGTRTFIWSKFPLLDSDGEAYAVCSLSTDITDRKKIEESLLRSEERFRLVSYATSDAVWDWNMVTDHMWWNESMRRLFGYAAENIQPDFDWWKERLHPKDKKKVVASIHAALEEDAPFWSKEFRFRRADGTYADVFDRGYLTRDDEGKPIRMVGAMMDITRWREVEAELATERNLLRTLIDHLPDDVYAKDTKSRFILGNPALARIIGVAHPDNLMGKTDFDFYPAELAAQYYADEQSLMRTGQPLLDQEEFVIDKATGEKHWNLTTKIPLNDSQGNIAGLVGISRDITTLKRHEEDLTGRVNELEQRRREISLLNEMIGRFQTCTTIEQACAVIAKYGQLLFPDEAGVLYLINPAFTQSEQVVSWGPTLPDPASFPPDDCLGLLRVQMHVVESHIPGKHNSACPHIPLPVPNAYVCMPLLAEVEVMGLLHIRCLPTPESENASQAAREWFTETKQQLVRTVAQSLSLALVNLKLRETLRQQSIRDPLSGMFNRRYLEESLEREILRASRGHRPLGVIMLDIDHFKRFNDNFGHEAGDAVLRELGAFLRSNVRGEDIACRYGGEEFVLIMPDASLKVTQERAEKLRKGVKRLKVQLNNRVLESLTISLGIAMLPEQGANGDAILRAADDALYEAKEAGRDCVVTANNNNSDAGK